MPGIRLIPCLDIRDNRVVKGVNFIGIRDAGDPVELAKMYDQQGADELVFLDITASSDNRPTVIALAERVAEQVFIPFTVGGGIRDVATIKACLRAGADKVSLNTAAIKNPSLISEAASQFGNQCIVIAIDAKRVGNSWKVFTHGGRNETGLDAIKWAIEVEKLGAGELLVTSMDGDGTQSGYDNALNCAISEATNIPLIASGGAGNAQHLIDAVTEGKADAVLLASILHDNITTVSSLKAIMARAGLCVRQMSNSATTNV
jgi:imidazole glycerol-phosphate synthase subunit HisF